MARTCGLASWYSISPNVDMGLSQTSKSLRRTGFYRDSPGSCHLDRARRSASADKGPMRPRVPASCSRQGRELFHRLCFDAPSRDRSEEHTSELQSLTNI